MQSTQGPAKAKTRASHLNCGQSQEKCVLGQKFYQFFFTLLFLENAFYFALNGCSGLFPNHIEPLTQHFSVAVALDQSQDFRDRALFRESFLSVFQLYVHVPKYHVYGCLRISDILKTHLVLLFYQCSLVNRKMPKARKRLLFL